MSGAVMGRSGVVSRLGWQDYAAWIESQRKQTGMGAMEIEG
jgi:hypothetical protein